MTECSTKEFTENARVLYISDLAHTKGHIYRVVHSVRALQSRNVNVEWVNFSEATREKIGKADIVIVFRNIWNEAMQRLYSQCREQRIPIGFDIDDLIFDPDVLNEKNFDFLRHVSSATREDWLENRVYSYRRAILESDFVIVSTVTLASAVRNLGKLAFVSRNGFDTEMKEAADNALIKFADKPSLSDGWIRLGYASGTPTHQKDFGTIAPILSDMMDGLPHVMLTIVGLLDLNEFPELVRHHDRIEKRDLVPHSDLLLEYARFDINLAPLEIGNPFCEAKSALKFVEAALVRVPTVAAATAPFREAISDGKTGWIARNSNEWSAGITSLIEDPSERESMGYSAEQYVLSKLGEDPKFFEFVDIYNAIIRWM